MPEALTTRSPEWWVDRLYNQLRHQQDECAFFDAYYSGDHPLPFVNPQAREEFKRLVQMTRSNVMGLVCDATAERTSVEGFRIGEDPTSDGDTWRIWEENELEVESDKAWLEALIGGRSYFLVAPNPDDPITPHVWVEHASQVIVAYEPGTNRRVRAAGLKVWDDDWTGEVHATLYLPKWIYKFRAERRRIQEGNTGVAIDHQLRWVERFVGKERPNGQRPNPIRVVPLIEIPNNPRLLPGGKSELYDLTDIQDRINKTLFDRLQTQEFGIDPQKWAKAFPDTDEDGNPNVVEFGRNRMITTTVAETGFGNFAVAPLQPLLDAKKEDIHDIASRSRTPAQYLLGDMSNVNGETLKASESGLVSKVKQRRRPYGSAASEAMTLARDIAGLPAGRPKPMWSNPEFRTEGELTDAVIKRYQAGLISRRQAREDVGYTQTQITALENDDQSEALSPAVNQILSRVRTPDATGDGGAGVPGAAVPGSSGGR